MKEKQKPKKYEFVIRTGLYTNKIQANYMDIMNDQLKFWADNEQGFSELVACFRDWEFVLRREIKHEGRLASRRAH